MMLNTLLGLIFLFQLTACTSCLVWLKEKGACASLLSMVAELWQKQLRVATSCFIEFLVAQELPNFKLGQHAEADRHPAIQFQLWCG